MKLKFLEKKKVIDPGDSFLYNSQI